MKPITGTTYSIKPMMPPTTLPASGRYSWSGRAPAGRAVKPGQGYCFAEQAGREQCETQKWDPYRADHCDHKQQEHDRLADESKQRSKCRATGIRFHRAQHWLIPLGTAAPSADTAPGNDGNGQAQPSPRNANGRPYIRQL
jgi:hypothetical protein